VKFTSHASLVTSHVLQFPPPFGCVSSNVPFPLKTATMQDLNTLLRLILHLHQSGQAKITLLVGWKINFATVDFSGLTSCDSVAHLLRQDLGDEPCLITSPANSS
jgi:hypothetical protein